MIPSIYMYFSCYSLFLNKYTGKKITINLVKKIINYKNEYQILLYNSHWLNLIIFNKKIEFLTLMLLIIHFMYNYKYKMY